MNIVNGKAIAERLFDDLKKEIALMPRRPRLAVVSCAPNFETKSFLRIKQKKAQQIGVDINFIELGAETTTAEAVTCIKTVSDDADAVLVQLPFPPHIERESLVKAIPFHKDADVFRSTEIDEEVMSPVAGAVRVIFDTHNIDVQGKRVVVIGAGRLVGQPVIRWLELNGAEVIVLTETASSTDIANETRKADIIVLGAGVAGLLKLDMIQTGVVIIDAGTTEEAGELRGDADPSCAEKASLFTPVPGGVGPLTVAILMQNVVTLMKRTQNK